MTQNTVEQQTNSGRGNILVTIGFVAGIIVTLVALYIGGAFGEGSYAYEDGYRDGLAKTDGVRTYFLTCDDTINDPHFFDDRGNEIPIKKTQGFTGAGNMSCMIWVTTEVPSTLHIGYIESGWPDVLSFFR